MNLLKSSIFIFSMFTLSWAEIPSSMDLNSSSNASLAPLEENLTMAMEYGGTVVDAQVVPLLDELDQSKMSSIFVTYEEAQKRAKEEHKIILLEVISTNCKFCQEMEEEVLVLDRVQEAINQYFILAQANSDTEELPLGLSGQMTPMFVFITQQNGVADMRLGSMDVENFLKLLEEEHQKLQ